MKAKRLMGVRISSSAQTKPATAAGFTVSNPNSVRLVSEQINYRPPEIVRANAGWYVKYYYRVPAELSHLYGKEWERFRVKGDINRRKGEDREAYADILLGDVRALLASGFNPFQAQLEALDKPEVDGLMSARVAFDIFLKTWGKRGLEKASMAKYERAVTRLADWLHEHNRLDLPVEQITSADIERYMDDRRRGWKDRKGRDMQPFSNREYNNNLDFLSTVFAFLKDKRKVVLDNPIAGIDKLKAPSQKHRYYDAVALKKITDALAAADPYALLAFRTVYYTCVRSDKEMRYLKVGNIDWEDNRILVTPDGSKGNMARYVPLDPELKRLFIEAGIDQYPSEYYVFGIEGAPAAQPFGSGFFSKRFRKVRIAAGLPDVYTLYAAKHTRVVHLKADGMDDATIMSLTGHREFASYAKYLRDIGMTADASKLNKSRKV
jgi:integrase